MTIVENEYKPIMLALKRTVVKKSATISQIGGRGCKAWEGGRQDLQVQNCPGTENLRNGAKIALPVWEKTPMIGAVAQRISKQFKSNRVGQSTLIPVSSIEISTKLQIIQTRHG